ncbi:uncharacterized protein LOC129777442 isoform X2 [Toxorhynchites rutilus septentrionalis]|uniref:uncharacterized protein LOC129777442 isoform X2 n=1 Tax=Toxorhynchites rutilus septentrionalis TaxID=329112 RepID=UPI0024791A61|nr:uncharacterized protein LOC129777442 isoform X2 [Toxorhynchites rutilus septentrionalis]
MRCAVLCLLLYSIPLVVNHTQFNCLEDRKYVMLNICVIENFRTSKAADLTGFVKPNVTQLEFRNPTIRHFGIDFFQLIADAKRVTLRNGFVREVLIHSSTIEELQVLVRSPVFSRWSSNLRFLTALEVIDIAYCNFSYLNLDWFSTFKQLHVLDVSNNRLHSVHSTPFLQLKPLEELYLAGNQLEFMWRFPDAFPNLALISLSENRWLCEWLSMARDVIWQMSIALMDSDFSCQEGWVRNGGVCCKESKKDKKNENIGESDLVVTNAELDIILVDTGKSGQELAIGAEMGNATVYFDELIPV